MTESAGQVNRYICEKCKAVHGTINLNTGTTPFLIGCRNPDCIGMAQSTMYRLPAGRTGCGWAWYRPIPEIYRRLSLQEQEHILAGGLILDTLEDAVPMKEGDDIHEILTESKIDAWLGYVSTAYKPSTEVFQEVTRRLSGKRCS